MKKIHLHTAAADNLGHFHDSGTDLVVGDAAQHGVISAERAKALLDSHGAVSPREAADEGDGLEKLKRPELVKLASDEGAEFAEDATRAVLIEAIRVKRAAPPPLPPFDEQPAQDAE